MRLLATLARRRVGRQRRLINCVQQVERGRQELFRPSLTSARAGLSPALVGRGGSRAPMNTVAGLRRASTPTGVGSDDQPADRRGRDKQPQLFGFRGRCARASLLRAGDLAGDRLTLASCAPVVRRFRLVALRGLCSGATAPMTCRGGDPWCLRQCCRCPSSSTRVPPQDGQGSDRGRYELVQLQAG